MTVVDGAVFRTFCEFGSRLPDFFDPPFSKENDEKGRTGSADTRALSASTCGSEDQFVDSGGTHLLETDAGLPLGIQEGSFSERAVEMASGSRLVLYSDGVTEAMNSSLQQYGETRLRDHVVKPSAAVQSLLDDARSFTAGQPAFDDATVVMIQAHLDPIASLSRDRLAP